MCPIVHTVAAHMENSGRHASGLNGYLRHDKEDDATSQCSTVLSNQDALAEHDDISSECSNTATVGPLLIFDWDDTLFPTFWLHKNGLLEKGKVPNHEQAALLERLAGSVRQTVQAAAQTGKVVLVTNAQQGWIEKSCTRFMPSLVDLLKEVDIVSARSTYEALVKEPSEWKRLAFQHEVDLFYGADDSSQRRNIVSVGDSLHELQALKSLIDGSANCWGKSVKLLECPSIEQLLEQHEVIVSSFADIVEYEGDLDVEIGSDSSP